MDTEVASVMSSLTNGIYVLTVAEDECHHGMSSSWVTQVSGTPLLFMAAVDSQHSTRAMIERVGRLGLNVVGVRGKGLEDYFYSAAAKRPDNLSGLDYRLSPLLGVPWLSRACGQIGARLIQTTVAGDHHLFVAEVVEVAVNQADRPLTSLDLDYVYLGGREVIKRDRSGW